MLLLIHLCWGLQDKLVLQQLGPAPPGSASPGMQLQYATMFRERRLSLIIDNVCSLVESTAALVVKVHAGGASQLLLLHTHKAAS